MHTTQLSIHHYCMCVRVTHKYTPCIHTRIYKHSHVDKRKLSIRLLGHAHTHAYTYMHKHIHSHTHPHIDKAFGKARSDNGLAIPFNKRSVEHGEEQQSEFIYTRLIPCIQLVRYGTHKIVLMEKGL